MDAPLSFPWGQVPLTPTPLPPTPEYRGPAEEERSAGENGLRAVGPPREDTHN